MCSFVYLSDSELFLQFSVPSCPFVELNLFSKVNVISCISNFNILLVPLVTLLGVIIQCILLFNRHAAEGEDLSQGNLDLVLFCF
jgi:hypothetical protein